VGARTLYTKRCMGAWIVGSSCSILIKKRLTIRASPVILIMQEGFLI